jgi:hypothetical protein
MVSDRWLGEQKEEGGVMLGNHAWRKMRREGRERDLGLKWEGEHVGLWVATEDWEELKRGQVLEMEEFGGSHERGVAQWWTVEQSVTTMGQVGVCGYHEIRTKRVTILNNLRRKVCGVECSPVKWQQKSAGTQVFVCSEVERKEWAKLCARFRDGGAGVEGVGELGRSVGGRGSIELQRGFGNRFSRKGRLAELVEHVGFRGGGGRSAVREQTESEERGVMRHEERDERTWGWYEKWVREDDCLYEGN